MGEVGGTASFISFILPRLPASMNAIYTIVFHLKEIHLKPEVRLYKTQMKMYVPQFDVSEKNQVKLTFTVWMNTLFKNGKLRKIDVHNMSKILVDLISEKQGWDDSQLFELNIQKKHTEKEEKVEIKEAILQTPKAGNKGGMVDTKASAP